MNNIPKNYDEITLIQYLDILDLDIELNYFTRQLNILAILTNTSPNDEYWENMDIHELNNLINSIKWINKLPSNQFKKQINNLYLINLNNLTLGEFIDIDYFYSQNVLENLTKICSILYRYIDYDKFGNTIFETYDLINLDTRSDLFYDISINDIFGIINYFNDFKQQIYLNYQPLFNPLLDNEDLDDEDLNDIEVVKEIQKEKTQNKWSWELILFDLAKGDITKYNEILNLPFIMVLNQLSLKKTFNLE